MRWIALLVAVAGILPVLAGSADLPEPGFYLPLDGSRNAARAVGSPIDQSASSVDMILTRLAQVKRTYPDGKVNTCYEIEDSPLSFAGNGNFSPAEGTVSLWLKPNFEGSDKALYCCFFGVDGWGMVYKYLTQTYVTFATYTHERSLVYDCTADIQQWQAGQWHQIAFSWSRKGGCRKLYLDGRLQATSGFPELPGGDASSMHLGAGCDKFRTNIAHACMDEIAVWGQALSDSEVEQVFRCGEAGRPLLDVGDTDAKQTTSPGALPDVDSLSPYPDQETSSVPVTATRDSISLDGQWHFQPVLNAEMPSDAGWGWCRVPSHFTHERDAAILPDGKPAARKWANRELDTYDTVWYARSMVVPKRWQKKQTLLRFVGLSGMADIFVNGHEVGTLLPWEDEDYLVTDLLRFGESNTIMLQLTCMGRGKATGIYGSVCLEAVPDAFVRDVVVRTRVAERRISFSSDIADFARNGEAKLVFEVSALDNPDAVGKTFVHDLSLSDSRTPDRALFGNMQRVTCDFAWENPQFWTFDAPQQYSVRAKLIRDDSLIDQTPAYNFGFRDFAVHDSSFYLNGVKTHLRGHQHALTHDTQQKLKDYYAGGMNCIELLGPISHTIASGYPYKLREYCEALDSADQHGIITIPVMYGALTLGKRIFDPDVSALYAKRLEKHIRRYGNHPSVCMWFMHFNGSGYRWYLPPTNVDGSYKPDDMAFLSKGANFLEAERICRQLDWRPLFHHSCGNQGSMYTLNCYIGPTSPLQEREEYPSRWAETKKMPLLAVEHGQMLIPYWYRERCFPLSVPYSSEPIFDEICAKYLGRRAYDYITPQVFSAYHLHPGYGFYARIEKLIKNHGGYQEVKALFTRHSLRSWRTFDTNAIIYNAIQWDFRDEEGKPLPVLNAHADYFSAVDFFIAGPEGDCPSKDHAFFSRERIQKQIVLLNDPSHPVDDTLCWELTDTRGTVLRSRRTHVTLIAGNPTFIPLSLRAPRVDSRSDFVLRVRSERDPNHIDTFPLQVFPHSRPKIGQSSVFLYDIGGDTRRMLEQAGVACEPLIPSSDLSYAALIIVGRRSFGRQFLAMAEKTHLEQAIRNGTNLLLFEQAVLAEEFSATRPERSVLGLTLGEQSARRVFIAAPGHPFLRGLAAEDFINLRGQSDMIAAYPLADLTTQKESPQRFFKWSNRGVVSTFVFTKPHFAPFRPVLECGFDLVDSPLLEVDLYGGGKTVLCQVDVTPRYGIDPVSTLLVDNLLEVLARRQAGKAMPDCIAAGPGAATFLAPFKPELATNTSIPDDARDVLIVMDQPDLSAESCARIEDSVRAGATALVLPAAAASPSLGLQLEPTTFFIARLGQNALLTGLNDGDTFLKQDVQLPLAVAGNGWELLADPGIVATKQCGKGRFVACLVDPSSLGDTRGRVKFERFWNMLLTNIRMQRCNLDCLSAEDDKGFYHQNEWEAIPPYFHW